MKKTILLSDLSGDEITEKNAATITVSIDTEDHTYVLDVTASEAKELGSKGTKKARLGRKKASVKAAAAANGSSKKGTPVADEELVGAGADTD